MNLFAFFLIFVSEIDRKISGFDTSGWAQNFFAKTHIKEYFEIDNKYLLQKLRFLIFPFLSSSKKSETQEENMGIGAPSASSSYLTHTDLYIPIMAYMTYVILSCFMLGLAKK